MKKVYIKLAKILGILAVALFLGVFIWANQTPLSVGEKQDPVNFITYDVADLNNPEKVSAMASFIKKIDGVGGCNNVPAMNAIIVTYKPLKISEQEILEKVKTDFRYTMHHKQFRDNGKRCPMMGSISFFAKVRRVLNIRG